MSISSSSLLRVLRHAAMCLIALVVMFGVVEVVLRLGDDFGHNGPREIRAQSESLAASPNAVQFYGRPWYRREFENLILQNEDGYHAESFALDPSRPRRIAILGDSHLVANQVPIEEIFTEVAERELAGTHLLALGNGAQFVPRQVEFFRAGVPELFGEHGKYAGIEGAVFCLRVGGLINIARGDFNYPVTMHDLGPRYRLKQRFLVPFRAFVRRGLNSSSHAWSFASHRLQLALGADLRSGVYPVSEERMDFAQRVLQDEVVEPILRLAEEREIPVAFLFLPSIAQQRGAATELERDAYRRVLEVLDDAGARYVDSTPKLRAAPGRLFFEADKHFTALGHEQVGAALVEVIRGMPRPHGD